MTLPAAHTAYIEGMHPHRLVFPAPWIGHIPFAFWIVSVLQPRVLVELGTHTGNSYAAFCQAIDVLGLPTKAYALDTWQGDDHAGAYGDEVLADLRAHHDPRYGRFSELLRTTFDEGVGRFGDSSIDLLHIDGLHTYEAVRHDFETWLPKLSAQGVVLFHDIEVRERDFGVYRFWEEITKTYEGFSFRHSNGLGVLLVGPDVPDVLRYIAGTAAAQAREVARFDALGRGLLAEFELKRLQSRLKDVSTELKERGDYIDQAHVFLNEHRGLLAANALQLEQERAAAQAARLQAAQAIAAAEARHELQEKKAQALAQERDGLVHHRHLLLTENAEYKRAIDRMAASRSWRATAGLRRLGRNLRRLRTVARLIRQIAAHPRWGAEVCRTLLRTWRNGSLTDVKVFVVSTVGSASLPQAGSFAMPRTLLEELRKASRAWPHQPKISLLMPTYNTDPLLLRAAFNSISRQIYPHWELCVADDCSTDPRVREEIAAFAKRDRRVKPVLLQHNQGVSAATNRAFDAASGDFVALMDHDDLLEPQALFRLAESMVEDAPDFIYSDEVIVDEDGESVLGYALRPQFSAEYLRAHPYIVHMVAFRAELFRSLGGLDEHLTISQDYDLILRATEAAHRIVHIPEILYRWRTRRASVGHQRKDEVMEVSQQVLRRHLERLGWQGTVSSGPSFNFFDVRQQRQAGLRVAIVIPTKNHGALVRQCIESIERTCSGVAYDIVVVNHDSTDAASIEYFDALRPVHHVLDYSGPFNFSTINNWAVRQLEPGRHSHYLFCNNDIEAIEDGWLARMLEIGQRTDVGAVGAKLLYPDHELCQHAGVGVGMFGAAEHYGKFMATHVGDGSLEHGHMGRMIVSHEMSAVTAACMLVSRAAFDVVGGYDDALAVGFGDVDLCLRIRQAGLLVVFCAPAVLVHHESFSRGKSTHDPHPEDSALFRARWAALLAQGDPYFNPNFSSNSTRWAVRESLAPARKVVRRVVSL